MDAQSGTGQPDNAPAYTTSKQVQAWFLGRSRDRWKKKCTALRAELKRLKQRVADVGKSRDGWRSEANAARLEVHALRARNAELQAQLDARAEDAQKK
jgi:chromosome segregation ATPase